MQMMKPEDIYQSRVMETLSFYILGTVIFFCCATTTTAICTATGGDKDGECIFPFKFKGTSHSKCGDYDNSGREWCATTVKSDNEFDNWGYCDCHSCPTTSTSTTCTAHGGDQDGPCIFPFEFGGTSHSQCGDYDNYGKGDWCATKVKRDGKMDKYGYCNCGCYVATNTTTTTWPPCYVDEGKFYPGRTVEQFENVESYASCRSMCSSSSPYFVWRGPASAPAGRNKCNCKNDLEDGEDKPGIYSGNTICQGVYWVGLFYPRDLI